MIAAIPAEDRPNIIVQAVPVRITLNLTSQEHQEVLGWIDDLIGDISRPRTCLSCGAKTDEHGTLPCGH